MGPQHPSTHGVLRLIVELEGETVTDMRTVIGYLHTGIEKNTEYRTWTQAVTFLTRADYLAPLFNETAYCLAVEKLLGVAVPAARAADPRCWSWRSTASRRTGSRSRPAAWRWARSPR